MRTTLFILTSIIGFHFCNSQSLEDLTKVDTIVITFKESVKFRKYVRQQKSERQPCAQYYLNMKKPSDYSGETYIYLRSCRYKSEPPRDIKIVKKKWFKNKIVLSEDFFHRIGFVKSSRNSELIGKVYYLYEVPEKKSGKYKVEEVQYYSSYEGYE